MKVLSVFLTMMFLCLTTIPATAAGLGDLTGEKQEFLPVEEAYQASFTLEPQQLNVDWVLAPGYYLYKEKFHFSAQIDGTPQELKATFEPGLTKYDEYLEQEVEVYYTTTRINLSLKDLPATFLLKVKSQGCADAGLCYAPHTQYFQVDRKQGLVLESEGNVSSTPASGSGSASDLSAATQPTPSFWLSLLMALIGGLILNLMPCVFPVLSLKALGLASSGSSPHRHHLHGWAYTIGVIGSFVVAALVIIAAKTAGEHSGWGFQLQSPTFVAILCYLFLVMGLSLSGMMHFGTTLMGVGQGLTEKDGLRGSFFTGVLAAVVASPCTGPMMAPALGYALTQSTSISLAIFIALGFGMALPFLILSYSPKLASLLPRPGVWMEKLKEVMAFPMYITAAWLLFVFGRQVGMHGVFSLVLGAVAIVFSIWLWQNQPESRKFRTFTKGIALIALVFVAYVVFSSERFRERQELWQPYSKSLVQELRAQGQPVLVDFTADWCITCKTNEALALSREGFKEAVAQHNVALLRGDWTNENPAISEALKEFGRSGVPLYLLYPADTNQPPELLPQLLTQALVIDAIERASNVKNVALTEQ